MDQWPRHQPHPPRHPHTIIILLVDLGPMVQQEAQALGEALGGCDVEPVERQMCRHEWAPRTRNHSRVCAAGNGQRGWWDKPQGSGHLGCISALNRRVAASNGEPGLLGPFLPWE